MDLVPPGTSPAFALIPHCAGFTSWGWAWAWLVVVCSPPRAEWSSSFVASRCCHEAPAPRRSTRLPSDTPIVPFARRSGRGQCCSRGRRDAVVALLPRRAHRRGKIAFESIATTLESLSRPDSMDPGHPGGGSRTAQHGSLCRPHPRRGPAGHSRDRSPPPWAPG